MVKRISIVVGLVLAAAMSFGADVKTVVNPETVNAIKTLAQAFDGTPVPRPEAQPKTIADVADKALDLTTAAVTKIAGQMETIAPEVWKVIVIQQYAKAISGIAWPLGLMLIALLWHTILHKNWTPECVDGRDGKFIVGGILPLIAGAIFAVILVINLSEAIPMLINPRYYAVKDIIHLVLSPGSM